APIKDGINFTIDPSASEASFTIQEVLFGRTITIVGKTSQVAGQILVDKRNPSRSQVGQITADLSALVTDTDFRNLALRNRIFETRNPAIQFATVTPKLLTGLPSSIAVGQPISLQITGDLTIHQTTRTSTFVVQVTAVSETQLVGQAQTTVRYKDFQLTIPSVPEVGRVADEVQLELAFTAHAWYQLLSSRRWLALASRRVSIIRSNRACARSSAHP